METFVRGGSLEAILDANGDAVAAWEIVEVPTGPVSPSRSIRLRIAKEIEPGAVGLFLIGAVMTLQTGGDVKCQPRQIEGIEFDGVAQHPGG